jgi:hypothetical protein
MDADMTHSGSQPKFVSHGLRHGRSLFIFRVVEGLCNYTLHKNDGNGTPSCVKIEASTSFPMLAHLAGRNVPFSDIRHAWQRLANHGPDQFLTYPILGVNFSLVIKRQAPFSSYLLKDISIVWRLSRVNRQIR